MIFSELLSVTSNSGIGYGSGADSCSSAPSKTGSAIVPATSSISVVSVVAGSVCSGIVACGAITAGVGLGAGISLFTVFCRDTAAHKTKLAVIAAAMAIRFLFRFLRYETSARSPGPPEE